MGTVFTPNTVIRSSEINANFDEKANLASPTFTGTLTAALIVANTLSASTIVGTTITGTSIVGTSISSTNPIMPASGGNGGATVQTKTTTYQILSTDGFVNCSGSAFTVTLPAASGLSGKKIVITKTDSSLTNIITIEGSGSETIDGQLNTALHTQYESVTAYCDGSNWFLQQRKIPSGYQSWTPTFTGFGTASNISAYSWREGRFLCFNVYFLPGTTTATEARVSLGFAGTDGNVTTVSTLPTLSVCGSGGTNRTLPDVLQVLQEASKTYITFANANGATIGLAKSNGTSFAAVGTSYFGKVAINGWNG